MSVAGWRDSSPSFYFSANLSGGKFRTLSLSNPASCWTVLYLMRANENENVPKARPSLTLTRAQCSTRSRTLPAAYSAASPT